MRVVLALVALMGVLFIVIGIWRQEFWARFFNDVGIALVTASVLGLVLESYLREKLFTHIEQHIGSILPGIRSEAIDAYHMQRLPTELLEFVRKTVIEPAIIQRDVCLDYKMKIVSIDSKECLRAEVTSTAIYENLTHAWQNGEIYEGSCNLPDGQTSRLEAGFVNLTSEIIEGTLDTNPLNLNREHMEFYIYEQRGQEHFKRPCRFSPRCRLRVTFSEVAYFDLEDGDFFVVSKPSIDMKIKVSFDGGKFDVRATPDDALVDDWEIGDEPGQWKIGGALLPG